MADDPKDPKDPKDPADPKDPKDPAGDDKKADNLQKALDEEREARKKLERDLKKIEDDKEDEKKKAEQKKLEEEGKYKEALDAKQKEIDELKPKSERLDKLLESASEANKKTIDSIEDEDQKKFVEQAIEGKDALDAQSILGNFQSLLGKDKPAKKSGQGIKNDKDNQDGADDVEITKLKEELEAIFTKRREGKTLSNAEEKRATQIPKEIKELRNKSKED